MGTGELENLGIGEFAICNLKSEIHTSEGSGTPFHSPQSFSVSLCLCGEPFPYSTVTGRRLARVAPVRSVNRA